MKLVKVKTAQQAVKKRKITRLEKLAWLVAGAGLLYFVFHLPVHRSVSSSVSPSTRPSGEVWEIEESGADIDVGSKKSPEIKKSQHPQQMKGLKKNNTTSDTVHTSIALTPLDGSGKVYNIGEQQAMTFKSPFSGVKQAPEKQTWKSPFSPLPKPSTSPKVASSCRIFKKYKSEIMAAYRLTGVEPAFIAAVIQHESGGNPRAVSYCGAVGLMQLMPYTAKTYGCKDRYNARQNVLAGSKYLKALLGRYKGNKRLVLAAYNAGEGAVDKYKGIPPYRETKRYVPAVMAHYEQYKTV